MPSENVSVSAILTWKSNDCEDESGWISRDYADTLENLGNKKRLSLKMEAPQNVKEVQVELVLKWHGSVCFSKPLFIKTQPIQKRTSKIATAYIKTAGTEKENLDKIIAVIDNAAKEKPDLICFAETLFDRGDRAAA